MARKKILVADDDRKLLELLAIQLRAAGYDVSCAQDGCRALELARREDPDLLLLDINMPAGDGSGAEGGMAGVAALAGKPVLYLTGDRSQRAHLAATGAGACGLIYKPFESADLLQRIEAVIGRPDGGDEAEGAP